MQDLSAILLGAGIVVAVVFAMNYLFLREQNALAKMYATRGNKDLEDRAKHLSAWIDDLIRWQEAGLKRLEMIERERAARNFQEGAKDSERA